MKSFLLVFAFVISFHVASAREPVNFTWETAKKTLKPYTGPSAQGLDVSTLHGKVVVGYQGWFATPNDGGPIGWKHYQFGAKEPLPGKICIDFWPDLTEFDEDEICATNLVCVAIDDPVNLTS